MKEENDLAEMALAHDGPNTFFVRATARLGKKPDEKNDNGSPGYD